VSIAGRRLLAGWAVVGIAGGFASPLSAQTASQITPPSFAPPPPDAPPPIVIPAGAGAQAPAGAEALQVSLGDIAVEGGAVSPALLADLKRKLIGRRVAVSDIFAAARELEAGLARTGHVLVRVTVPPQRLSDGATLRLVVVNGFIERIDTNAVPQRVRRSIERVLAPLAGASDITLGKIERRLLLAADTPGVSLRSTLAAGTTPGGTLLVVEARHRTVSGFATIDDPLPRALGRYAFAAGVNLNALLGAGETLYLRANGLPGTGGETRFLDSTPRNRALAAGLIVPLGHDGLTVNVEATDARTAPRHDAALPGFASRFQRFSARLRYPVVRTRSLSVWTGASFDAQNEQIRIIDPVILPISRDRLRIARATGDLRAALPGNGAATLRVRASFGLDALGARSAEQADASLPLSRSGADADFQKLELQAGLDQPLTAHMMLALRVRGQTSFGQALANSEQIGLATADGLSPLPAGAVQGDAGYVARGELRLPFPLTTGSGAFRQITPYAFGAYGGVRYEQPTFLERPTTEARAYGAGLRLWGTLPGTPATASATVEYGRAHVQGRVGHPDRFSVIFAIQI
jgi:hemolysin activation/secretion protein